MLYMTVLNFDLHCFPIVLNINNVRPVYQLLMEVSHNLDLKYMQTMIAATLSPQKVKIQLFQNMVMLHIKGIANAATW